MGVLDVKGVLDELKSRHFQGNVAIEYASTEDEVWPAVQMSMYFLRCYNAGQSSVPEIVQRQWLCADRIRLQGVDNDRNQEITIGEEEWRQPWVPDRRAPGRRVAIPLDKRMDIIIFCDGNLPGECALFETDLHRWYAQFLSPTPWRQFRGAFRVRGIWTPSEERAGGEHRSRYQVGMHRYMYPESRPVFETLRTVDYNQTRMGRRLTHATLVMMVYDQKHWPRPQRLEHVARRAGRSQRHPCGGRGLFAPRIRPRLRQFP